MTFRSDPLSCKCGGIRVVQGDDSHRAWVCQFCASEVPIGRCEPILTQEQLSFFDPPMVARAS